MKSTSSLISAMCLCVFSQVTTAAAKYVTLPGTECVEYQDASPEIYYTGGNAGNNASGKNTFVCPVPTFADPNGIYKDIHWDMVVHDKHPTENFSCYLRSCNLIGTSCSNSASQSSHHTAHLTLHGNLSNWGSAQHYVQLRCSIPGKWEGKRSLIKSYTIGLIE